MRNLLCQDPEEDQEAAVSAAEAVVPEVDLAEAIAVASAVDPDRVVLVDTAPAALAQDPADSIDLITITTIITIFPFLVSADPTMATDMEAVALED